MNEDTFLDVEEHFDILLKALSPEDQRIYREARNTRIETGYRGRSFVLYSTDDIGPVGSTGWLSRPSPATTTRVPRSSWRVQITGGC